MFVIRWPTLPKGNSETQGISLFFQHRQVLLNTKWWGSFVAHILHSSAQVASRSPWVAWSFFLLFESPQTRSDRGRRALFLLPHTSAPALSLPGVHIRQLLAPVGLWWDPAASERHLCLSRDETSLLKPLILSWGLFLLVNWYWK